MAPFPAPGPNQDTSGLVDLYGPGDEKLFGAAASRQMDRGRPVNAPVPSSAHLGRCIRCGVRRDHVHRKGGTKGHLSVWCRRCVARAKRGPAKGQLRL